MMSKALKLIAAAEQEQDKMKKGKEKLRGNPFGKSWGYKLAGTFGSNPG